jgi:hypothetical protein
MDLGYQRAAVGGCFRLAWEGRDGAVEADRADAESGTFVVLEKAKAHKWLAELPVEAEEMRRTFAVTGKDVV